MYLKCILVYKAFVSPACILVSSACFFVHPECISDSLAYICLHAILKCSHPIILNPIPTMKSHNNLHKTMQICQGKLLNIFLKIRISLVLSMSFLWIKSRGQIFEIWKIYSTAAFIVSCAFIMASTHGTSYSNYAASLYGSAKMSFCLFTLLLHYPLQ